MSDVKPTRTRLVVLAYLCSLTFILYLDRVCIQQAESHIRHDLGLTKTQMSYVMMAFTLAYGVCEVPTGHWGDRIGARAILTRIVVWWSIFTALTSACRGLWSLLVVRFIFGAGEAGALPNIARVVARWFPTAERGRVQGFLQTTMLLGGAASPVIAAYIITSWGWRWAFILFGLVGVIWAALFWLWFRNDPAEHPAVNAAELAEIGPPGPAGQTHHDPIPWKAALANRSVWTLATIMICGAFNSYLYLSWFSTYLKEGRKVAEVEAGWLVSMILAGGAVGMFAGGFIADQFVRRKLDPIRSRRRLGGIAYVLAALLLWVGIHCEDARLTAGFSALSCLATTTTLATWWTCVMEVSGKHLGALFGLMNGLGVFGAMGSQFFFGRFPDWRASQGYTGRDQWDPAFMVVVGVLLLAAVLWSSYVTRPVEPDSKVSDASNHS